MMGGEDEIGEEKYQPEENAGEGLTDGPTEISLNSVLGFGTPKTMKLKRVVQDQEVCGNDRSWSYA